MYIYLYLISLIIVVNQWLGGLPRGSPGGSAGWVARCVAGCVARGGRQRESPTTHPGTDRQTNTQTKKTAAPKSKTSRVAPPRSDIYIYIWTI